MIINHIFVVCTLKNVIRIPIFYLYDLSFYYNIHSNCFENVKSGTFQ